MKKISYFLLLFVVFSACSSDDNDEPSDDFFIRFKVDGDLVEYAAPNHPAPLFFDTNANLHTLSMAVVKPGSDGTRDFINIIVWNEAEFTTGETYQMQNPVVTSSTVQLSRVNLTWANEEAQVYNAVLLKSQYPGVVINNDAQVRLTELSADVVRGTFSGVVIGPNIGREGNPEFQVTDGEFRLKLTRTHLP